MIKIIKSYLSREIKKKDKSFYTPKLILITAIIITSIIGEITEKGILFWTAFSIITIIGIIIITLTYIAKKRNKN